MAKRNWAGVSIAALMAGFASPAMAVEGATSFYLPGSKTTMAGYLPPPGVYGVVQNYFYTGSANITFESGGVTVSGDINADAYIAMPTALWVLDQEFLGGHLAFTVTQPIGYKQLNVDGSLTGPLGNSFGANLERDNWAFGDTVFGTALGWHDGNLHYTLGTLLNIPIGQWDLGNPVNIGFNRWILDATGAVTYLNPESGIELSGAAGFTFNFDENPDTNYKSGNEFHFEAAAMKHLSKTFSIGVNGYGLTQISGDSGSGAKLGAFEGQVFGIGPAMDYTFVIGQTPVMTNLRYFYEFGAENRMEGHAGYFNVTIPLGGHGAAH